MDDSVSKIESNISLESENRPTVSSEDPATSTIDNDDNANADRKDGPDYSKPLSNRLHYFLKNNLGTDVSFRVGEGKEQETVLGHKLILATASPVFYSMFYGGVGTETEIQVPDCDPESFRAAIEYLYKGTLPMIAIFDKPSEMLYIARKYYIQPLEDECCRQLREQIEPETAIEVMRIAHVYDLAQLLAATWDYITRNVGAVLQCCAASIERDLLVSILEQEKLNISEGTLFMVVKNWAVIECRRNDLEITGENLRTVLGDALNLIRFPTMTPEEIATDVFPTGILTMPLIASIFISMYNPAIPSTFKSEARGRVPLQVSFQTVPASDSSTEDGNSNNSGPFFGSNSRAARRARRRSAIAARRERIQNQNQNQN